MTSEDAAPTYDDVVVAAGRLEGIVHRTPLTTCSTIDQWVGCRLLLKCEHLQRVGAFKFRGATNAVLALSDDDATNGVAAHSSGNHAAALALAARTRGVPAHVVMPTSAPVAKRAATAGYGAEIIDCAPTLEAREATLAEVLERTGAVEIHPYDHPHVIAGAGTASLELLEQAAECGIDPLDAVVVPVGGGGLASGTVLGVRGRHGTDVAVFAAEPTGADDAARSLAEGHLIPSLAPDTVCDGLLTSLSPRTFSILSSGLERVVTVTDDEVLEAMRLLWERAKMVVEPSGAIAVAATRRLVAGGEVSPDATVGVILSGGNVDLDALPF
ncbi:MAG: pyridoxal-phosphate dependent enzyme [Acidimicrobiia bacterium]|nr:pyridoxal-phosphate dependent enzyme [Acidimicrobiia bacterium]